MATQPKTQPVKINPKALTMLKELINSDNADVKFIARTHANAIRDKNTDAQNRLHSHYQKNGSLFIIAVFNGDLKKAVSLASENDKELLTGEDLETEDNAAKGKKKA
jgi:hypothetical protein